MALSLVLLPFHHLSLSGLNSDGKLKNSWAVGIGIGGS